MAHPDFSELRQLRAHSPEAVATALASRSRRPLLADDGRMMVIACDHPARGSLGVGGDPVAMADREELLRRLLDALAVPGVDGLLATPDLVDDLALLGALEDKIVVGSLNRGGLSGARFEMDDRFGAYSIAGIVDQGLDAAKTLTRINFDDEGSAATLEATAHAVTEAAAAKLPIMVEPFISRHENNKVQNDLSTDAVIRSIAIASALGTSSAYTWLKVPYVEHMERVMAATTLPAVILGGDPGGDSEGLFTQWAHAMKLDGVMGLMVGRSLLYPSTGTTSDAVARAVDVVHG